MCGGEWKDRRPNGWPWQGNSNSGLIVPEQGKLDKKLDGECWPAVTKGTEGFS